MSDLTQRSVKGAALTHAEMDTNWDVTANSSNAYTDSGAADVYVATATGNTPDNPVAYFDGMRVHFTPDNNNTGSSTINVEALGVVNIKLQGGSDDPGGNQLVSDKETTLVYRTAPSAHFELQLVGGGPSLGVDSIIRTNAKNIAENITFAGTENGSTVGPVTIDATFTVTVTSGSTWVIL